MRKLFFIVLLAVSAMSTSFADGQPLLKAQVVEVNSELEPMNSYSVSMLVFARDTQWFDSERDARQWCQGFNQRFFNSCQFRQFARGWRADFYWDRQFIGRDLYSESRARSNVVQAVLDFLANDNIAAIIQLLLLQFLN